jgi:hypothetical protein
MKKQITDADMEISYKRLAKALKEQQEKEEES